MSHCSAKEARVGVCGVFDDCADYDARIEARGRAVADFLLKLPALGCFEGEDAFVHSFRVMTSPAFRLFKWIEATEKHLYMSTQKSHHFVLKATP